jgi:hypothetical protein
MNVNIRRSPEEMGGEQAGAFEPSAMPEHMPKSRRGGGGPMILVLTIVIILAVGAIVFKDKLFTTDKYGDIATGDYQAVFLTNGQVYFGSLSNVESRYLKLSNIYYLQVTPVLQTTTPDGPEAPAPTQQQQLSLVKLGNELHGPVDEMYINRDQVLFIEDLKEDGRVVQAIKDFEENQ